MKVVMRIAPVALVGMTLFAASCGARGGHAVPSSSGGGGGPCSAGGAGGAACRKALEDLLAASVSPELHGRVERRVLARTLAENVVAEARASGALTEAELDEAAAALWPRWNDGPVVDVVHALFVAGPDAERRARSFANSLARNPTEAAFEAAAKAANANAVERINGIGNRGRNVAGIELVREFSDAAVRMTMDSPRSDVIHTAYGSHIVLLLERHDPVPLEPSARLEALRDEAMNRRVRARVALAREKHPATLEVEVLQTLEIPAVSP